MTAGRPKMLLTTPWDQFGQQAIDYLRALIRLDTTNPPGNERRAADYLAAVLKLSGLDPVIVESVPSRANVVARLRGSDGSLAPLMLSSHTDVVPAEGERWRHPPFSAEIAEGCIWGRGAIDMKSKCAMDVALMAAVARAQATPVRDLVLAAVADEESGSQHGARFLVEQHAELIRAGFVLNEVGGFTMYLGNRRYYPIQVAEKGFVTVKMTVRGEPGHGSIPRSDTAVIRLAALIGKLAATTMPERVTAPVARTLSEFGLPPGEAPHFLRPMLSDTVTTTMIYAGYKDNVIPGEAWALLDGRTLPGQDTAGFLAELREIIGDEPILEVLKEAPAVVSDADTPLFRMIAEGLETADPGARAIPWMIPGATDDKFYTRMGALCYGFAPVKLGPAMPFGSLYHGTNERIPIDGFLWGLEVYARVVLKFLGLDFAQVFS
jgi:acetylornithine deacetylase/succinyl-diaminopimelate desuccinylase-like protein